MIRLRKSVKKRIKFSLLGILAVVILLSTVFVLTKYETKQVYEEQLSKMQQSIVEQERWVYVALRDIMVGEMFTEENIVRKKVYSDAPTELFAKEDILSQKALFSIAEGTRILHGMGVGGFFTDETRECVFSEIELADVLQNADVIDIRIQYPNGENYCVVSKKQLQRSVENVEESRFWLSEQEQLYLSSAIYDKSAYSGTRLYAVRYIADTLQNASYVDYIPVIDVTNQLTIQDKKAKELLLQQRNDLEQRLSLEKPLW